jgi:hypothetical protein
MKHENGLKELENMEHVPEKYKRSDQGVVIRSKLLILQLYEEYSKQIPR